MQPFFFSHRLALFVFCKFFPGSAKDFKSLLSPVPALTLCWFKGLFSTGEAHKALSLPFQIMKTFLWLEPTSFDWSWKLFCRQKLDGWESQTPESCFRHCISLMCIYLHLCLMGFENKSLISRVKAKKCVWPSWEEQATWKSLFFLGCWSKNNVAYVQNYKKRQKKFFLASNFIMNFLCNSG